MAIFDSRAAPRLTASTKQLKHHSCIPRMVRSTLHSQSVIFADMHRDRSDEPIHLNLLCPIKTNSHPGQPAAGVVVLMVDANRFLYLFVQRRTVPSNLGDAVLVLRDGNQLVYLYEPRHLKGVALNLRISVQRTEIPAVQVVVHNKRAPISGGL